MLKIENVIRRRPGSQQGFAAMLGFMRRSIRSFAMLCGLLAPRALMKLAAAATKSPPGWGVRSSLLATNPCPVIAVAVAINAVATAAEAVAAAAVGRAGALVRRNLYFVTTAAAFLLSCGSP